VSASMKNGISRRDSMALMASVGLLPCQPCVASHDDTDRPARLSGAVTFDLGGQDDDKPWQITLYIPPGPAPKDGWPVLYLLDGNAVTATAIDIERVQASYPEATGITSRFVIVGVGYPTSDAYDTVRRCWDYTPPPGRTYPSFEPGGPAVRTGGAPAFLDFVLNALKPAIERRCPVHRAKQALFGHSFGGLFTLYALANAPTAFSHWIAASPSIYWEDRTILKIIDKIDSTVKGNRHVLIMVGAYEEKPAPPAAQNREQEDDQAHPEATQMISLARALATRLDQRQGLKSRFQIISRRTHMAVLPDALNEAVAFFLGDETDR